MKKEGAECTNITIICPFYFPNFVGGAEVSVKILAEWLASHGFNVQVISFNGKSDLTTIDGVKVRRYPVISTKGLSLTLIYPVLRAMRKFEDKTDIYHVYDAYPMMGAGLYKALGGKRPVVATLDNYSGFCPVATAICSDCNKFEGRMTCLFEQTSLIEKPLAFVFAAVYPFLTSLAKKIDKYIAPSNNVVKLYSNYNFSSRKIILIPNFIKIPTKKSNGANDNNTFNILYVGAISEHKGVDVLIHAFKIIADKESNAHLTLVGKGSWIAYCKSLVKNLEIEGKVTFTGYVEDAKLEEIYAGADVFVHPTRFSEPFGRTIIEALSYRLPCIVSDMTSPEIIGNAGLVFKNEDAEDLAKKLEIFIKDQDLQSSFRNNCFEVVKRYDIDLIGAKIADLYHELCPERNHPKSACRQSL